MRTKNLSGDKFTQKRLPWLLFIVIWELEAFCWINEYFVSLWDSQIDFSYELKLCIEHRQEQRLERGHKAEKVFLPSLWTLCWFNLSRCWKRFFRSCLMRSVTMCEWRSFAANRQLTQWHSIWRPENQIIKWKTENSSSSINQQKVSSTADASNISLRTESSTYINQSQIVTLKISFTKLYNVDIINDKRKKIVLS